MSRIIKSSKVSLGKEMDLDNKVVIKNDDIISSETKVEKAVGQGTNSKPVAKTQEEIEEMYIEEARKKSELFFDTEMRRAYNEGMERANTEATNMLEDARAEAEKIIAEAVAMKNNISDDYKKIMESMEKDIVDLVIEVAEKVVAKEIKKPDYIVGIVTEAIDKASSKKDTILKISEEDYDFIIENKEKLLLSIEGFGEIEVVKESSLERGTCIVETKFGIIDGSIKTRMKQIEKEVLKILNR